MTQYCILINGIPSNIFNVIPPVFNGINNFNGLTAAQRGQAGWYTFVDNGAPSYNHTAQTLQSSYSIDNATYTVTKIYTITDISVAAWQTAQIQILSASYQAAVTAQVSFTTAAGVTKTFQADSGSVANLQASIAGCQKAGATPTGFYWVTADNTQVPMTYADLLGLAEVIFNQGASAFQKLQTLKAQVNAATTIPAVQAIVW